jgi:anti-sigma B factor antagonist
MEYFTSNREGDTLSVYMKGRLDTKTSPIVQEAMEPLLDGIRHLKLDMEALNYISSAGLRVLLYLLQKMEDASGDMELYHVNEVIRDVFDVTGLLDVLTIV